VSSESSTGGRYRFELRRVNLARRCYTFVNDIPTYYNACLTADIAVRMLGGDFVIWDNVERVILYDSRKIKFADLFPPADAK